MGVALGAEDEFGPFAEVLPEAGFEAGDEDALLFVMPLAGCGVALTGFCFVGIGVGAALAASASAEDDDEDEAASGA